MDLKGSHVVISGAASGIGRTLAKDFFVKEKCHLYLFDKHAEGLNSLATELKSQDPELYVEAYAGDLTSNPSVNGFLASIQKRTSSLDILVNSAGVFYIGAFEEMQIEDFENVIAVDLLGAIRLTRSLLPLLLQGKNPTLVNLSSLAGLIGAPGMSAYSAAKFGLTGFSDSLRSELKGRVHVCTVSPSFVQTPVADHMTFSNAIPENGKNEKVLKMNDIVEKFGATPEKVSNLLIDGIKKKKKRILINPEAHFLVGINRLLPSMTESIVGHLYKKLQDKGVLK